MGWVVACLLYVTANTLSNVHAYIALLHAPAIHYTSEWFVARRGFANGVIGAGQSLLTN
jgi:hypothetical protein